ncbi:hypothetical protein A5875_003112 [Enterococcus sp. 3H8_DIV0648]|nr:hypothetical protein A5875_003112 [Enterococcus sp. 3H8_DIV0648]
MSKLVTMNPILIHIAVRITLLS